MLRNTKWVFMNFLSFESEALERYLEENALKGWQIEKMIGAFIKFRREEPKRIKYSVDIMDTVSFFDTKNSENALEYREYCEEAGWKFVCEREKFQVYSNENSTPKIKIHTDNEEKHSIIFNASIKFLILQFLFVFFLFFNQTKGVFGQNNGVFLSNDFLVICFILSIVLILDSFIYIIKFLMWLYRENRGKESSDKSIDRKLKNIRIQGSLNFILVLVALFTCIYTPFSNGGEAIGIFIITSLFIIGFVGIREAIGRSKIKSKRGMSVISYFVLSVFFMIGFANLTLDNLDNRQSENMDENTLSLTIRDFVSEEEIKNAEPPIEVIGYVPAEIEGQLLDIFGGPSLHIEEDRGTLAYNLYYSNSGGDAYVDYTYFQSDYEWILKARFDSIYKYSYKGPYKHYEIKRTNGEEVKIYSSNDAYLFVSKDKIIEFSDYGNIGGRKKIIEIVCNKIFA